MDAASRPPLETSALIDEILDAHRGFSEGDDQGWVGYRNHAQRVFLFASQLVEARADAAEQLAIAAAFHDIAVFRTVDYLVPNARAMQAWLARRGCSGWAGDITAAMTLHHRIRPYAGPGPGRESSPPARSHPTEGNRPPRARTWDPRPPAPRKPPASG